MLITALIVSGRVIQAQQQESPVGNGVERTSLVSILLLTKFYLNCCHLRHTAEISEGHVLSAEPRTSLDLILNHLERRLGSLGPLLRHHLGLSCPQRLLIKECFQCLKYLLIIIQITQQEFFEMLKYVPTYPAVGCTEWNWKSEATDPP